jgi:hypothetical protein
MWRLVDLVWTDVLEERIASIWWENVSWTQFLCNDNPQMFLEPAWASDCSHLLTPVPRSRIFLPWRWRRYVPPKRRFTEDLHGSTSQKTAFFVVTAVKTSNLTEEDIFLSRYEPSICPVRLKNTVKNSENPCHDWDSNRAPPEYKFTALPLQLPALWLVLWL